MIPFHTDSSKPSPVVRAKILVVEDEEFMGRYVQLKLVELGYEPVGWAATGEQAISLAGQLQPDLVLMDVMLDGAMDGIAAARVIRDQFGLPVVFLTAYSDDEIIERAKLAGPFGYIIKPFTDRELRVGMEMALYMHRTEARLRESEDRYRALADWSPEAISAHRDGKLVYANPAALKMFGATSADDLLGMPSLDRVHPNSRDATRSRIERILAGESMLPVAELQYIKLDGSVMDVEVHGALLTHDGLPTIYAAARDVTARGQAQAALRESEQRYRALVEWSPDAFAIHRKGKIVEVNPAAVRMFGARSAEDLVGRDILELIHPDFHQSVLERLTTVHDADSTSPILEMKFLMLDGTVIDVEAMGMLFPYQGQTAIYSTIRDIGARLRAAERQSALHKISDAAVMTPDVQALFRSVHGIISELLPARNFYVALHDQSTDVVTFPYFVDEFDAAPEPRKHRERRGLTDMVLRSGKPLLISPDTRESTFARPDVELIGTNGFDWLGVPLRTEQGVIGVLAVQSYSGDVRYTETDKELLQFVSGQVAFAVERKQSQQALRESEQLFRSVFDQSPSIISLVTFPEGKVEEMNTAGLETFGFSREEMTALTADDLNLWVEPAERRRYLALVHADGVTRNFEAKVRRRNGEVLTLLHNGSTIRLGEKAYVLNSVEDITERKLAQDSLQSSLREKEALLREVHHRVKNNLQVITSLLRLEMGRGQNADARTMLSDMQGRIQSMAMLHESLYRSGVFAGVDLGAYLGQLASHSFRTSSSRSGSIRLHLDLASVLVDMDQAMPCGLLVNELVSNCFKHGFPNDDAGEVRIQLLVMDGGPQLRLQVSDTGVGLPQDFDARREASLGLQLVGDLVTQLGGTLEIGPKPAAMFTISFTPNTTAPSIVAGSVPGGARP